jgi:exopolysaccharide production protein ExoQ
MKPLANKLYFFAAFCLTSGALATLLGSHATLTAGATSSAFSSGASDPVLLAINMAFALATTLLVLPRVRSTIGMLGRLVPLSAAYLLVAASMIWSEDPGTSFRTACYLLLYLISATYIAMSFENAELDRLIGMSTVSIAILSVPGQYLFAPEGPVEGWTGMFPQKNGLGMAMAIGVVALIAGKGRWNLLRIGSIALCISLLVLSQSFAALVACVGAVTTFVSIRLRGRVRYAFLSAVLGGALIVPLAVQDLSSAFTAATGKDLTLTGRTEIWALVLQQISRHPILGYGYGAFWSRDSDAINQFVRWSPGQSHNGYLEVCLDLGMVGLVLILLLICDSLRRARRLRQSQDRDAGAWLLLISVLLVSHNFAESDFLKLSLMWFVFVTSYLSCAAPELDLLAEVAGDDAEEFERLDLSPTSGHAD